MSNAYYNRDYALVVAGNLATGAEGGFMQRLAEAFFVADADNAARIVNAWPHVFRPTVAETVAETVACTGDVVTLERVTPPDPALETPSPLTLEERVARLEARTIDHEMLSDFISLRELADHVAGKLPGYLDYDDLAAALDIGSIAEALTGRRGLVRDIAEYIDASDIAEHFDAEDIARHVDMSDLASDVDLSDLAGYIDSEELAGYIDASKGLSGHVRTEVCNALRDAIERLS